MGQFTRVWINKLIIRILLYFTLNDRHSCFEYHTHSFVRSCVLYFCLCYLLLAGVFGVCTYKKIWKPKFRRKQPNHKNMNNSLISMRIANYCWWWWLVWCTTRVLLPPCPNAALYNYLLYNLNILQFRLSFYYFVCFYRLVQYSQIKTFQATLTIKNTHKNTIFFWTLFVIELLA